MNQELKNQTSEQTYHVSGIGIHSPSSFKISHCILLLYSIRVSLYWFLVLHKINVIC